MHLENSERLKINLQWRKYYFVGSCVTFLPCIWPVIFHCRPAKSSSAIFVSGFSSTIFVLRLRPRAREHNIYCARQYATLSLTQSSHVPEGILCPLLKNVSIGSTFFFSTSGSIKNDLPYRWLQKSPLKFVF